MSKTPVKNHGSATSYSIGFVLSIILTLIAYIVVSKEFFDGWRLAFILLELAIFQLWVQMVFFLHMGRDAKVRWNLLAFVYMTMIVLIIGIGSIWIMNNIHYVEDHEGNPIPKSQLEEYIIHDEGH